MGFSDENKNLIGQLYSGLSEYLSSLPEVEEVETEEGHMTGQFSVDPPYHFHFSVEPDPDTDPNQENMIWELNLKVPVYHRGPDSAPLLFARTRGMRTPPLVVLSLREVAKQLLKLLVEGLTDPPDGNGMDTAPESPVPPPEALLDKIDPSNAQLLKFGPPDSQNSPNFRENYALEPKPLGGGSQAEVFKATYKPTGEEMAFKRFKGRHARGRGPREINITRELEHPNIVSVNGYDTESMDWYVLPLAEHSLFELEVPAKEAQIISIFSDILDGLEHAHNQGYVHRDLNPNNILRMEECWVISDWGLGRWPRGQTTELRTESGQQLGTPGFIAPEVYDDAHDAEQTADFYSLGRVLGWLITGSMPTPNSTFRIENEWQHVVANLTRQEPEERPQDHDEIRTLLDSWL